MFSLLDFSAVRQWLEVNVQNVVQELAVIATDLIQETLN